MSYSWKIFNKLKAKDKKEDKELRSSEDKKKIENKELSTPQPLNLSTSKSQGSELYFRVRDKIVEAR